MMVMFAREIGLLPVVVGVPVLKTVPKKNNPNLRLLKNVTKPVVINVAPVMKCVREPAVTKPATTVPVLLPRVTMFGNVKVTIQTNAKQKPVPIFLALLEENLVDLPAIRLVMTVGVFPL
jgi:hypothetical protein